MANNKQCILINIKEWEADNKLLSTLIANKVDKDLYDSYLKLYKSSSINVKDSMIALDIDSFKKYLVMIKTMYINIWDKSGDKDRKALDMFWKLSFLINRYESMIEPKKSPSHRFSVYVKIDDLMNIKNALGAAALYCDNEFYAKQAALYRDLCQHYIDGFERHLELDYNRSMTTKPYIMANRIKAELKN